ncbi:unnamed protein product [Notodromas monacha]|uniref:TATA box-binding protein-like 1 n=1 Tax=Notodromas monacha TaxID=399045 RepID=A0A7R9G9T4_9CRUS|nr:unnamed protein product [Notodromas monacha]CAG0912971.1 unnamed protein product [Notodromas monacha]
MSLMSERHMIRNGVVPGMHQLAEPVSNKNLPPLMNGEVNGDEPEDPEDGTIDIVPRNIVCNFKVGCHLDLKMIALKGCNVQYRSATNVVLMKLRRPMCTAHIWSSGRVTCTGSKTEPDAKRAARKVARFLQKLKFPVKLRHYRIVNILATCSFPFGVKLEHVVGLDRKNSSYEPELHPGLTYKVSDLSAVLKIFSTGSVTITAPSLRNVQMAVEHVYPLCSQCRKVKESSGRKEELEIEEEDWNLDSNPAAAF